MVQRTSGNGTLNLSYSGWNLIEERNASGELEQVYVHGAGVDDLLLKITATGPAYYHHDGLGSTIALTGENGELLESYRYDAFGAVTILSPSTLDSLPSTAFANRFLFTGREWLSEIGLYDYRNRVYSAELGRFLQTDPIRFAAGDVNLYRYVANNPINLWDPLGLCPPEGPPGAYVDKNMAEARKHFYDPFRLNWFKKMVQNKGPWDYKQQGRQYQDFGNFNYGATGNSAGIFSEILLRAAGHAQQKAGTSRPEWGSPFGGPPYGDDPADQEMIKKGIEYSRKGGKGKCDCKK